MNVTGEALRITVVRTTARLRTISPNAAALPRVAGKWSPKEILGHLIDSATNNHGRFVRAQLQESMRFEGYEQDGWVRVQGYADADWSELIALWERLNLHLANVMDRTSPESLHRMRTDHNLHLRAFRPIPEGTPTTLAWFMEDYVEHLKHHLRQIDPVLVEPGAGPNEQVNDGSLMPSPSPPPSPHALHAGTSGPSQ